MSLANNAVLDRDNLILKNSSAIQPWLVCLTSALFFFYEFIQMGMFNSLSQYLMRDFSMNATQIGNLSATYFYADISFVLFAGILIDRFSVRKIILSAMCVCVLATFSFALSTSVMVTAISHFAAGAGNAFCLLSCVKLCARWFPARRMALVIGLIVTIAMLGGVTAQAPLAALAQSFGWRNAVMMDGVLGILILGMLWYFIVEHPAHPIAGAGTEKPAEKGAIRAVFLNRQNWLGGFYTCFLNLPILLLGELWGVMYLVQVDHLSHLQASYVTSMIFVGTIIGSPLVGWISDRMQSRRMPMIAGAVLSLVVILIIMLQPNLSFMNLLFLFLALGMFTSAQIITYPVLSESNPVSSVALATGHVSALVMSGGAAFQPLFGSLMELSGDKQIANGVALYSTHDFMLGMSIIPCAFILGLIAAFFIRETRCQLYS